jgi:hypothetical protein
VHPLGLGRADRDHSRTEIAKCSGATQPNPARSPRHQDSAIGKGVRGKGRVNEHRERTT